ncbi:MAG: hypothetical protein HY909_16470 [Deltaproteobacteria bacterium]|nr:hypothetical protein [Deltaproteobacteria bacterium]
MDALPEPPDTEVLYDPPSSPRATVAAWVASAVVVAFALFVVIKVAQGWVMATIALVLGALILLVPALLGRQERPLATRKITFQRSTRTLQVTARGRSVTVPQGAVTDVSTDTVVLSGGVSLAVLRIARKDAPSLVLALRDAAFAEGTARALKAALGLVPPAPEPAAMTAPPVEHEAPAEHETPAEATLKKP